MHNLVIQGHQADVFPMSRISNRCVGTRINRSLYPPDMGASCPVACAFKLPTRNSEYSHVPNIENNPFFLNFSVDMGGSLGVTI